MRRVRWASKYDKDRIFWACARPPIAFFIVWFIAESIQPIEYLFMLVLLCGYFLCYYWACWEDIQTVLRKCKGPSKLWKVDSRHNFSDPLGRNALIIFWDIKPDMSDDEA